MVASNSGIDAAESKISKPFDAHCFCHMGTAIKHPVPDRIKKASFVILAYGHSEAQD